MLMRLIGMNFNDLKLISLEINIKDKNGQLI